MEPTVGRTNLQNEIAVINGVDIPSIAYFDMIGAESPLPPADTKPTKLVNGRAHRRALFALASSGRLSVQQWLRERGGHRRFMFWRLRDPAPFFMAVGEKLIRTVGRSLRRVTSLFGAKGE